MKLTQEEESCVELSYHREAVKCKDCGVVSEDDGWCSVVEHKYNCEYKLQLEAREEIMDIVNKEANSSNVLQGTLEDCGTFTSYLFEGVIKTLEHLGENTETQTIKFYEDILGCTLNRSDISDILDENCEFGEESKVQLMEMLLVGDVLYAGHTEDGDYLLWTISYEDK